MHVNCAVKLILSTCTYNTVIRILVSWLKEDTYADLRPRHLVYQAQKWIPPEFQKKKNKLEEDNGQRQQSWQKSGADVVW